MAFNPDWLNPGHQFQRLYEDVRDNLPAYLVYAGYLALTAPLSYARAAHAVGSGLFYAGRLASSYPETTREAVRGFGNALQDVELQSPYMTPLWWN